MRAVAALLLCAWVLWQQQGTVAPNGTVAPGGWGWTIVEAVQNPVDCEIRRVLHDRAIDATKDENGYVMHNAKKTKIRNVCLPDTIDPRAPKR